MTKISRLMAILTVVLIPLYVAGCTVPKPLGQPANLTFSHLQPLDVNVAAIQINDQYKPPLQRPNVEHTLINPPYRAAFNMMQSNFTASGAQDVLHLDILKASIVAVTTNDTVSDFRFWRDQTATKYVAHLKVRAQLKDDAPPYSVLGEGTTAVKREVTIPDTLSLAKREAALNGMVENIMIDLKTGLVDIMKNKILVVQP